MPFYRTSAELDLEPADLPACTPPSRVLLADPKYFDVLYAINAHMTDASGALRRVDRERARVQWLGLRTALEELGARVDVVPPLAEHPDLVFVANQTLPLPDGGWRRVVPSRMASRERAGEVDQVTARLVALGATVEPRLDAGPYEGTGDGIWHPGRRLLWAGVGPRSRERAWRELAERYGLTVIGLALEHPEFYHLDTCFAPLDERTCLWVPTALDAEGRALVERGFPRRIEADEEEARDRIACNVCPLDGRHVLIEANCPRTSARLEQAGFRVRPVDTSEFVKAGGSVFCLKLAWG